MEAFPGLRHSGRSYRARDEARRWSLQRVLDWLSEHAVPRLVNRNGKVSLYDRDHWVGRQHIGKRVWVTLDPDLKQWVIMDERSAVLKRVEAAELSAERIRALSVSRERRDRGQT
jgi:hypothetical protein